MDLRDQLQAALGPAYTLERELGGGGMSRVFVAEETRLGRKVVVKVLAPELAAGVSAERFEREIRLAAALQQANIVPVLTAGEIGRPAVLHDAVRRGRVAARAARGADRSPIAEAVEHPARRRARARATRTRAASCIATSSRTTCCSPAARRWSRTSASRRRYQRARDAEPTDATLTQLGTSIGTPAYMAPEQAAGDPGLDHRADLYAFGVLGYELLAGHPPFEGTPQAIIAAHVNTPPPAIVRRDDLPPSLVRIIMKCLSKDPAGRHQSANELLADIEAVATPSGTRHSASPMRPTRVLAGAGAVAALVALVWFGTAGIRRERWVRTDAIPADSASVEATCVSRGICPFS